MDYKKLTYYLPWKKGLREEGITKPKLVVPLVILAFVVVCGLVGYMFYHQSQVAHKQTQAYNKAIASANSAVNHGNYVQYYQQLKAATGLAQTKAQKAEYYHDLAYAAYNNGHIAEAISDFLTAHSLDPSLVGKDADTLGQCYQRIGDKTNALKQYNLAITYYQQPAQAQTAAVNDTIPYIQDQIHSLGAQ